VLGSPLSSLAGEATAEKQGDKDIEILPRMIRIDFEMTPQEEEEESRYVVVATPKFKIFERWQEAEENHTFSISGTVRLIDESTIFVQFEIETGGQHEGEAHMLMFAASIRAKSGQPVDVGRVGDQRLIVRATFAEDVKP